LSVLTHNVGREMTTAVFPRCRGCAHFGAGPAAVCLSCARPQLALVGPDACPVCSQRAGPDGSCPNELCRSARRRVGRIHAVAYQAGPLRRVINDFKYRDARDWPVILGRLLLGWLDEHLVTDPPDLIVANPSFVGPGGQLFAHTEAVIEAAAAQAGARSPDSLPWQFDTANPAAVIKTAPTLKSADAPAWYKRATATDLAGALRVPDPARTEGRFILVYDDICTTGGQLNAIAGCLLDQGGAVRVEGLVLARAPWRGDASR
jgi:predicted amidophosphoribosyltransferase